MSQVSDEGFFSTPDEGCNSIAVIDLGYTYHPQHEGHLWVNPDPRAKGGSGWDCHDDDAGYCPDGGKRSMPDKLRYDVFNHISFLLSAVGVTAAGKDLTSYCFSRQSWQSESSTEGASLTISRQRLVSRTITSRSSRSSGSLSARLSRKLL